MFIYNKILKEWEQKGFYFLFICTISFFIIYWFLFTSDKQDGTYDKINLKPLRLFEYKEKPKYPIILSQNFNNNIKKSSKGETECRRVLENIFNRPFPNVRPKFLKNVVTGENLELDMYNPELRLACEYNGQQHYKFNKFMHKGSSTNFQNQQYRDIMKRDLCKKNNINLIEVPYTIKHDDIEQYIIYKLKNLNYI